jgi:hypothetical protein
VTDTKATVTRLVTEVMNGRNLDLLDEMCTPQLAPKLRRAFTQVLDAFPDWQQEIVELVAEGTIVVAGEDLTLGELGSLSDPPAR